jgi:hypothetical protein
LKNVISRKKEQKTKGGKTDINNALGKSKENQSN